MDNAERSEFKRREREAAEEFEEEVTIEVELAGFSTPEVDGVELYARITLDVIEEAFGCAGC